MHNTQTFKRLLISSFLSLLVSGCVPGGSGSGDTPAPSEFNIDNTIGYNIANATSCPVSTMNYWVYQAMQDYYLFYDQVDPNVNLADYDSPEKLMRALRVQPNDRYSYVTDATTYNAFFEEGKTFGYGWNFASSADNTLLFSLVEPNSPLDVAGVMRGEQLLNINGLSIPEYRALTDAQKIEIMGTGDEVKTLELTIAADNQADRQVSVTKSSFTLQSVLDTKVIEHNNTQVGYLSFYQFVNTSAVELDQAFSLLDSAGVSELVLDLRFNGGGRISIANELASRIIGDEHDSDVFTTFARNDKYQANNRSILFQSLTNSLSLNRVFVLQSKLTCSASELVINSLRPFMEVITVGDTSCGKPYATSPNTACGKVANALEIELLNAEGVGGYFEGIAADCAATEDVSYMLGIPEEPLLAASLNYISTGSCTVLASRAKPAMQKLTDEFKPAWQGGNSL